jgi:hypothetical protein
MIFSYKLISCCLRDIVAERYQMASGESMRRDGADIKRHFTSSTKLFNKGRKPTGHSGTNSLIAKSQFIWEKIRELKTLERMMIMEKTKIIKT